MYDMYDATFIPNTRNLRRPLAWSLGLHVAFTVFVVLYATFCSQLSRLRLGQRRRRRRHGSDARERVPLPANPTETTNVLATESKGLSKSQPTVQEKEPEAIPIPDKNAKTK
jgi:hypothetical protein